MHSQDYQRMLMDKLVQIAGSGVIDLGAIKRLTKKIARRGFEFGSDKTEGAC